jgi:3-deoxy-manno-octulosonate cytidylyltransferase (CMP-KDO synthetase)
MTRSTDFVRRHSRALCRLAPARQTAAPARGEPLVLHVARRALAAGAREVWVAADDTRIADALAGSGVRIAMDLAGARLRHRPPRRMCATRRLERRHPGGEPAGRRTVRPGIGIRAAADTLVNSGADMATLATPITDVATLLDPNAVSSCELKMATPCTSAARRSLGRATPSPATATPCRPASIGCATSACTPTARASCAGSLRSRRAGWNNSNPWNNCGCSKPATASRWHWRRRRFPAGVDTPEDLMRAEERLQQR